MKRILLIGNSPLPTENERVRPAAGLRTWQFLQCLLRVNNEAGKPGQKLNLLLVTIAMPECNKGEIVEGWEDGGGQPGREEPGCVTKPGGATNSEPEKNSKGYSRFTIHKDNPGLKKILQEVHDEFQPDVIIAVNTYPSKIACQLRSHAPLWADLNGWIMAEAQAQAYKMDSNDYLWHYAEMERVIIGRTDKFSAVSEAEGFALLGELASAGRLNRESFGYKFVEHVPNGIEWFEGERMRAERERRKEIVELAEREAGVGSAVARLTNSVPGNAFVLLWVGGYNTWVDEITLFKAVNEAMAKCGKLYFVSTGGEIAGLDSSTFAKFKKMIGDSEFKERFVFLGWLDTAEIPALYDRADIGINVDRRCVETLTGARNRINEMMKFGLPVVTTGGSEIAAEVGRVGAGMAVKSGDHGALSAAIEELYGEWRGGGGKETVKFKEYGKKGREYVEKHCNYTVTLRPLFEWLENPRPAPDRWVKVGGFDGGFAGKLRGLPGLRAMWQYLKQNGFKKSFGKFLQRVRR